MARPPLMERGDIVRFPNGEVDWEVVRATPDQKNPSIQRLTLRSGQTDRLLYTTNHLVVRTKTWEEVAEYAE